MAGKHFALRGGNGGEGFGRIDVQLLELVLIRRKTAAVVRRALRVGLNQRGGHIGGITLHQQRVVPHMRVEFAVIVVVAVIMPVAVVVAFFQRRQRFDALRGLGIRHFALLHRPLQLGFFQAQAVEQHQLRRTDLLQIAAGEVVGVRILIGADNVHHFDTLAADLFGDIAQNAEAAHHFHRLRLHRQRQQRRQDTNRQMFHVFPML